MKSEEVIKQWNSAAETFAKEQEQSAYAKANKRIIKERFKKFNGEKILDLGCGYGYYTDYFKSIGGEVIGVDGSETMIEIARQKYPECKFEVADITARIPFNNESFDMVFCNQVLMDIENIESVLSECFRVLKPNAILYFSITHPAFYNGEWKKDEANDKIGKLISSYITPGYLTNNFWGETKHFHRPLSFYLNASSAAGFVLVHTEEPKVYADGNKNEDLPLFFFAEYRK